MSVSRREIHIPKREICISRRETENAFAFFVFVSLLLKDLQLTAERFWDSPKNQLYINQVIYRDIIICNRVFGLTQDSVEYTKNAKENNDVYSLAFPISLLLVRYFIFYCRSIGIGWAA